MFIAASALAFHRLLISLCKTYLGPVSFAPKRFAISAWNLSWTCREHILFPQYFFKATGTDLLESEANMVVNILFSWTAWYFWDELSSSVNYVSVANLLTIHHVYIKYHCFKPWKTSKGGDFNTFVSNVLAAMLTIFRGIWTLQDRWRHYALGSINNRGFSSWRVTILA